MRNVPSDSVLQHISQHKKHQGRLRRAATFRIDRQAALNLPRGSGRANPTNISTALRRMTRPRPSLSPPVNPRWCRPQEAASSWRCASQRYSWQPSEVRNAAAQPLQEDVYVEGLGPVSRCSDLQAVIVSCRIGAGIRNASASNTIRQTAYKPRLKL